MIKHEPKIAEMYLVLQQLIEKDEIRAFVYDRFKGLVLSCRKRRLMQKCISFSIFRQKALAYLSRKYLSDRNESEGNALMDYIDNTFAFLFFKSWQNRAPLHQLVDDEFYFALLPFAIDRIEFPSFVNDEVIDSFRLGKRNRYPLPYRNYRGAYLPVVKTYLIQIFQTYANVHNKTLDIDELEKLLTKHESRMQNAISEVHTRNMKFLNRNTSSKLLKVYRGYDISDTQDVIVERKIRRQDANRSCSFTLSKVVAKSFAEYKLKTFVSSETTLYSDRIALVADWCSSEDFRKYSEKHDRKYLVSEYEVPLDDVILTTVSTTVAELEVIAVPDFATLKRYTFVNAT